MAITILKCTPIIWCLTYKAFGKYDFSVCNYWYERKEKGRDQKRSRLPVAKSTFRDRLVEQSRNKSVKKKHSPFFFGQFTTRNHQKKWKIDFSIWNLTSKQSPLFLRFSRFVTFFPWFYKLKLDFVSKNIITPKARPQRFSLKFSSNITIDPTRKQIGAPICIPVRSINAP